MRAAIFVSTLFLSFGIGVAAAYALVSSADTGIRSITPYQQSDTLHQDIKIFGIVTGVDAATHILSLVSPSSLEPGTNRKLQIDYGSIFSNATTTLSVDGVTAKIVGSAVSVAIKNQSGHLQADFVRLTAVQS